MNIGIIGTGYVGLVTGTCLAELGHTIYCIDINKEKIDNLNQGIIPIYEPGLDELVLKNVNVNRLFFTTDYKVIQDCEVVFSSVGTPSDKDGSADLQYVLSVAKEFSKYINKYTVFVNKSTVPVSTADKVKSVIQNGLKERNVDIDFDVVSNPEFLKEGSAIQDFMNPDRIVIGCDNEKSKLIMQKIYCKFDNNKLLYTSVKSAEMIKYAANSMLAVRISFINDIANLCDKVGANIEDVSKGIGLDSRIGPKFLQAGCGYGGSCFPKDVRALIKTGEYNGISMNVIKAAERTNESQKHILYKKLCKVINKVDYPIKNITVLGTSFKPNTDDMREATSIVFINDLLEDHENIGPFEHIKIYDPIALNEAKKQIGYYNDMIIYCDNISQAIKGTDVIVIITEWEQFKRLEYENIKYISHCKIIIDGRNILNRENIESLGYIYEGIGK